MNEENWPPETQLIAEALREAAWKAKHGTPEERRGWYLGKQEAVEKAAARVRAGWAEPPQAGDMYRLRYVSPAALPKLMGTRTEVHVPGRAPPAPSFHPEGPPFRAFAAWARAGMQTLGAADVLSAAQVSWS